MKGNKKEISNRLEIMETLLSLSAAEIRMLDAIESLYNLYDDDKEMNSMVIEYLDHIVKGWSDHRNGK